MSRFTKIALRTLGRSPVYVQAGLGITTVTVEEAQRSVTVFRHWGYIGLTSTKVLQALRKSF